jgi:hypothetical protein
MLIIKSLQKVVADSRSPVATCGTSIVVVFRLKKIVQNECIRAELRDAALLVYRRSKKLFVPLKSVEMVSLFLAGFQREVGRFMEFPSLPEGRRPGTARVYHYCIPRK